VLKFEQQKLGEQAVTLDRRIEILRITFPEMDDDLLVYVAKNSHEKLVAAGDRICEEGETGDAFYVIMSGRAQVSKFMTLGEQRLLTELGVGKFFGELALIEDAPRVASVDALTECDLLVITKGDFLNLLQESPAMVLPIIRAMAARLRDSDQRTIQDLRDKADQLALAYSELKNEVRRKSEFLTTVAHELRTPLTSIKGYAQLMRAGMIKGDDLPRAFSAIINNSEAITRLVNNILFMQELELITPVRESIDLREALQAAIDTAQARATESHLTFDVQFAADLPPVRGDRDSLSHALDALIDNAIKFSPDGGVIKIVGELDQDNNLKVAINDPGVGIAANQLYHVFDRFQHLDRAGDHLFGGIGLGLPIAKQVIEQLGGSISVVSKLGEGSTFTVTLPRYVDKKSASSA
jgi:signal transduction histidine kinase